MINIVFDVGNVLLNWNPEHLYQKIIPDPERRAYVLKNVITKEWIGTVDAGTSIQDALSEQISRFPEYEAEIRAYYDRWPETIISPIWETVDILTYFAESPSYNIWAITNFGDEKWEESLSLFPFLTKFDGVVVSGKVKMVKPNANIYQYFFQTYHLEPADCIFIDDRLENVQAAEALGMRSIQFKSPQQLKQELSLLNIAVNISKEET